jgi:hypothetical protein
MLQSPPTFSANPKGNARAIASASRHSNLDTVTRGGHPATTRTTCDLQRQRHQGAIAQSARLARPRAADVACLQELKADDAAFPARAIADAGYMFKDAGIRFSVVEIGEKVEAALRV